MADGAVSEQPSKKSKPSNPAEKPWRFIKIVFDGAGDTSQAIEKGGFGIVDLHFPVLLAGAVSFTVSMEPNGDFQPLGGVSIDATAGSNGTTLLAGYTFFKVVQAVAEAKEVHVGMLMT